MSNLNKVVNTIDIIWALFIIAYSGGLAIGRILGIIQPCVEKTSSAAVAMLVVIIIMEVNRRILGLDDKKNK